MHSLLLLLLVLFDSLVDSPVVVVGGGVIVVAAVVVLVVVVGVPVEAGLCEGGAFYHLLCNEKISHVVVLTNRRSISFTSRLFLSFLSSPVDLITR